MHIVIAEDDLTSRNILTSMLTSFGHEVTEASDGEAAWEFLSRPDAPRLALLDWVMPGMDGIEVCKRVKALKSKRAPYIIILTALGSRDYVVEGFSAGADDYVVKPVNSDELRSRVAVGERIIAAENCLYREKLRLEQIVEERARLLVHADRMATVGTLAAGAAHEINNPATFVAGNIRVLEQCVSIIEKYLPDTDCENEDERLSLARRELPKIFTSMRKGISRIENIVGGLLTYSRKSKADVHSIVDLEECIEDALQLCHNKIKYNVTLKRKKADVPALVRGNEQQLVQVLVNLIVNAADAVRSQEKAALAVETGLCPSKVTVTVSDSGSGIPEDMLDKIYDPFFSTKEQRGTGLGLSISKNIIEMHRGGIRAENRSEGGTRFTVTLPRMHCEQKSGGVNET